MNWTGGSLQRHSKSGGKATLNRQRQYFAKSRARVQKGPGQQRVSYPSNLLRPYDETIYVDGPSRSRSTEPRGPRKASQDTRWARRNAHRPTAPLTKGVGLVCTQRATEEVSPTRADISFERKRKRTDDLGPSLRDRPIELPTRKVPSKTFGEIVGLGGPGEEDEFEHRKRKLLESSDWIGLAPFNFVQRKSRPTHTSRFKKRRKLTADQAEAKRPMDDPLELARDGYDDGFATVKCKSRIDDHAAVIAQWDIGTLVRSPSRREREARPRYYMTGALGARPMKMDIRIGSDALVNRHSDDSEARLSCIVPQSPAFSEDTMLLDRSQGHDGAISVPALADRSSSGASHMQQRCTSGRSLPHSGGDSPVARSLHRKVKATDADSVDAKIPSMSQLSEISGNICSGHAAGEAESPPRTSCESGDPPLYDHTNQSRTVFMSTSLHSWEKSSPPIGSLLSEQAESESRTGEDSSDDRAEWRKLLAISDDQSCAVTDEHCSQQCQPSESRDSKTHIDAESRKGAEYLDERQQRVDLFRVATSAKTAENSPQHSHAFEAVLNRTTFTSAANKRRGGKTVDGDEVWKQFIFGGLSSSEEDDTQDETTGAAGDHKANRRKGTSVAVLAPTSLR